MNPNRTFVQTAWTPSLNLRLEKEKKNCTYFKGLALELSTQYLSYRLVLDKKATHLKKETKNMQQNKQRNAHKQLQFRGFYSC